MDVLIHHQSTLFSMPKNIDDGSCILGCQEEQNNNVEGIHNNSDNYFEYIELENVSDSNFVI